MPPAFVRVPLRVSCLCVAATQPDWEREQRRNGRAGPRVRPRRPEDPLFQEYSARKARHATKQAELEKSEAFQAFLAQRAAHLAQEARKPHTMAGEREALKASRAHWRAVQQELQREADTAPVKRVIRKEVAATLHAAPLVSCRMCVCQSADGHFCRARPRRSCC